MSARTYPCPICGKLLTQHKGRIASHLSLHAERPNSPDWAGLSKKARRLLRRKK